jgi:hypothetical protein
MVWCAIGCSWNSLRDIWIPSCGGLGDFQSVEIAELAPAVWATETDRPSRRRRQLCGLLGGYLELARPGNRHHLI